MQSSPQVTVIEPAYVREKLKERLKAAIDAIESYELDAPDPISKEEQEANKNYGKAEDYFMLAHELGQDKYFANRRRRR